MRVLGCAAARRRLDAYHDGSLSASDQIDVSAHLDWCDGCAEALADMRLIRTAIRGIGRKRSLLTAEEGASLRAAVVSRIGAEQTTALSVRLGAMLDVHLIYAGLGAAVATVGSVVLILGLMQMQGRQRTPGSNENPVVVDARMLLPKAPSGVLMTAPSVGADEAFTLSAVVTREGRIVNLEVHSENGQALAADSREAASLQGLLGQVSRARFEPARIAGLPIAVNMVWMVAATTVHALKPPDPLTVAPPAGRRGRVSTPAASARSAVLSV